MSSFIFPPQRVTILNEDDLFTEMTFDASINELHSGSSEITDHPVEEGADISDHIRRKPKVLQINGIVSDTPIVIARSLFASPSVIGGDPNTRALDAHGFLLDLQENGKLATITTTLAVYPNMAVTGVDVTRNVDTGKVLDVNVTFREFITAETQTTEAPQPADSARAGATDAGAVSAAPAAAATATKSESILASAFSAFGG